VSGPYTAAELEELAQGVCSNCWSAKAVGECRVDPMCLACHDELEWLSDQCGTCAVMFHERCSWVLYVAWGEEFGGR
jgi:hypothetical protein